MPFYPDAETFSAVMTDLFGRVLAQGELAKKLQDSRNILRIRVIEPDFSILVNARRRPVRFETDSVGPSKPDVDIRLSADTLHSVWMGNLRLRDAFAAGKIKVEGSTLAALSRLLRFVDLFRAAGRLYPVILRERSLL